MRNVSNKQMKKVESYASEDEEIDNYHKVNQKEYWKRPRK